MTNPDHAPAATAANDHRQEAPTWEKDQEGASLSREERETMTHVYTTAQVFAALAKGRTLPPATPDEEADLIRRAQAGEETAVYDLVLLYAPAARNALARFGEALDREDAEQEVLVAFLETIRTHDPEANPQLAGRIFAALRRALSEAVNAYAGGWSIPTRSVERFRGILKRAEGDVAEGARIAPDYGMAPETFVHIARLLHTESIDGLNARADEDGSRGADSGVTVTGLPADPFAAIEDAVTVAGLWPLVNDRERTVTRLAYGFDEVPGLSINEAKPEPVHTHDEGIAVVSDAAIAEHLGVSRPTVQRGRSHALQVFRDHLTANDTDNDNTQE